MPEVDSACWSACNAHSNQGRLMLSFYALDVSVQEKITRFSIEYFLQDLAEQLGSPDQWQMAAADRAIVAYQRGEFDHALRCISVGEKPAHQRPFLEPFPIEAGELSLRSLWGRLVHFSSDFPALARSD
jgi:hypothetical protein